VAASSGYIKATPSGTFLGHSWSENSGNDYMGQDENRNGAQDV